MNGHKKTPSNGLVITYPKFSILYWAFSNTAKEREMTCINEIIGSYISPRDFSNWCMTTAITLSLDLKDMKSSARESFPLSLSTLSDQLANGFKLEDPTATLEATPSAETQIAIIPPTPGPESDVKHAAPTSVLISAEPVTPPSPATRISMMEKRVDSLEGQISKEHDRFSHLVRTKKDELFVSIRDHSGSKNETEARSAMNSAYVYCQHDLKDANRLMMEYILDEKLSDKQKSKIVYTLAAAGAADYKQPVISLEWNTENYWCSCDGRDCCDFKGNRCCPINILTFWCCFFTTRTDIVWCDCSLYSFVKPVSLTPLLATVLHGGGPETISEINKLYPNETPTTLQALDTMLSQSSKTYYHPDRKKQPYTHKMISDAKEDLTQRTSKQNIAERRQELYLESQALFEKARLSTCLELFDNRIKVAEINYQDAPQDSGGCFGFFSSQREVPPSYTVKKQLVELVQQRTMILIQEYKEKQHPEKALEMCRELMSHPLFQTNWDNIGVCRAPKAALQQLIQDLERELGVTSGTTIELAQPPGLAQPRG